MAIHSHTTPAAPSAISRRHFLRGATVVAAALPLVAVADVHAAAPSPIPDLLGAYHDACDRLVLASTADDDAEAIVADAIARDPARYEVSPGTLGLDRIRFHPWRGNADRWREGIAARADASHRQVGVTWFGDPATIHAKIDEQARSALAQGEAAERAYAELVTSAGLEQATRLKRAASEDLSRARAAIIGYRPRSAAEVAEKATALLELDGIDGDEIGAVLTTFALGVA